MSKYIFIPFFGLLFLTLGKSSAIFPDFMGAMAFEKINSTKHSLRNFTTTIESLIVSIESNPLVQGIFWKSNTFGNFTIRLLKRMGSKTKKIYPIDLHHICFLCFPFPDEGENLSPKALQDSQKIFNNILNIFFCDEMIIDLMKEEKIFQNLSSKDKENILTHKEGPLKGFFSNPFIQKCSQDLQRDLSLLLSYDVKDFLNNWEGFTKSVLNITIVAAKGMTMILEKNLSRK